MIGCVYDLRIEIYHYVISPSYSSRLIVISLIWNVGLHMIYYSSLICLFDLLEMECNFLYFSDLTVKRESQIVDDDCLIIKLSCFFLLRIYVTLVHVESYYWQVKLMYSHNPLLIKHRFYFWLHPVKIIQVR